MSTWNYRVLAFEDHEDMWFEIHEVFYDKKDRPNAYGRTRVCGGSTHDLLSALEKMIDAVTKPFLWGGDRFPEEYKQNENSSKDHWQGAP